MDPLHLALIAIGLSSQGHLAGPACPELPGFPKTGEIPFDAKAVAQSGKVDLQKVGDFMRATSCGVWVVGYFRPTSTDEEKRTARDRADMVRALLIKDYHVPGDRILSAVQPTSDLERGPTVRFLR